MLGSEDTFSGGGCEGCVRVCVGDERTMVVTRVCGCGSLDIWCFVAKGFVFLRLLCAVMRFCCFESLFVDTPCFPYMLCLLTVLQYTRLSFSLSILI